MSTYVLVHGAWHGAWCWYKVIPLLEQQGHRVIAPDLPGHGIDRTPAGEVTLQSYVERVCGILDEQKEPVILVGHSMGGMVITQAAEYSPYRIRTLVYLAAFLPKNGESLLDVAGDIPDSQVVPNMVPSEDDATSTLRAEAIEQAFYADCSSADVALARTLLVPQPQLPLAMAVQTSPDNFGRVPRIYIEALQDRAITPPAQKRMYTAQACQQVITMDTSHSPFFSTPEELSDHLLSIEIT